MYLNGSKLCMSRAWPLVQRVLTHSKEETRFLVGIDMNRLFSRVILSYWFQCCGFPDLERCFYQQTLHIVTKELCIKKSNHYTEFRRKRKKKKNWQLQLAFSKCSLCLKINVPQLIINLDFCK